MLMTPNGLIVIVPTLRRGNTGCDVLASRNAGALPYEFPRRRVGTIENCAVCGNEVVRAIEG